MAQHYTLSLPAAVLINLNIMIGAGVFVNTVLLAQRAGAFGGVTYLVVAVLLLPLIITFAHLLRECPGGTFYDFGALTHPWIGFVAGWSYFIAKLASAALGIHVFSTLILQLFPTSKMPLLLVDTCLVIAFSALNMLNLRVGRSIQFVFLALKSIPILFAIILGLLMFSSSTFLASTFNVSSIFESLPFVLYAFTGFEACCSLSRTIFNPEKNGPLALLISYSIGVLIAISYQTFFWSALGPKLAALSSYEQAFPALLPHVFAVGTLLYTLFFFLLNSGMATSSLGSAYGIMYSNTWNLFVLAQRRLIFLSPLIASLNKFKAPFVCAGIEGLIILAYLFLFKGSLVPLQQLCALGMIITYTLSTLSFALYWYAQKKQIHYMALLALVSCAVLSVGYYTNIQKYGVWPTLCFAVVLLLGIGMFLKNFPKAKVAS